MNSKILHFNVFSSNTCAIFVNGQLLCSQRYFMLPTYLYFYIFCWHRTILQTEQQPANGLPASPNEASRVAPIALLSEFFCFVLAGIFFRPSREPVRRLPHQTPFCRIALLFAACACDSKVSLLAGYKITK